MSVPRGVRPTVAHYVSVDTVFDFSTRSVVVRRGGASLTFTLVLPTLPDVHASISLFSKEYIPYLLNHGYVPRLDGNKVKLIPSSRREAHDPVVLSRLQALCDTTIVNFKRGNDETPAGLLHEFREAVSHKKMELASELIEYLMNSWETENVRRIHALFLWLNHRPQEASPLFKKLADEALKINNGEGATRDLEDALACDPDNSHLYKELERLHDSDPKRVLGYYLFGALHSTQERQSNQFLREARKYGPREAIIALASKLGDVEAIHAAEQMLAEEAPAPTKSPTLSRGSVADKVKEVFHRTSESSRRAIPKLLGRSSGVSEQPLASSPLPRTSLSPKKKGASFKDVKWKLANPDERELQAILNTLWDHYVEKGNWHKAEIVAQMMFTNLHDFDSASKYCDALVKNGKGEEALKLLFAEAQHAGSAQPYLSKIVEIDPKLEHFSLVRKQILSLLGRISYPMAEPAAEAPQDYIGENVFFMDHPTYVACYVGKDELYLISSDQVVVSSSQGNKRYNLELEMTGLSRKMIIRELLQKGLIPAIQGGRMTLMLPENVDSISLFQDRAQELLEDENLQLAIALQQFIECIRKSPSLALDGLKNAVNLSTTNRVALQELWADYLYSLKKMTEAARVYHDLARRDEKRKRLFLQRAFVCDPTNDDIDVELAKIEKKDSDMRFRCLAGYLHCIGTPRAEEFFARTEEGDPFINLARLNLIPRNEKQQRIEVFERLSQQYPKQKAFYETCVQVEKSTQGGSQEAMIFAEIKQLLERGDRQMALRVLDTLMAEKSYRLASRVLNATHRPEGSGSAFMRRELLVDEALDEMHGVKATADKLLSIYKKSKKWSKACAVAELGFRKCHEFEKERVDALLKCGKKKEAAHAALDMAYELLRQKANGRATLMLKQVRNIDPDLQQYFSEDEQCLIYLLEKKCK